MATTYKDYYIYYNGGLISSNEDTGLTAVNIYYNGTYIGEGAHTLNCSGQYMNGNVQIGNRTLNCSGQYMNGNVQVTTQARYKWQKYSAYMTYAIVTSQQPWSYTGRTQVAVSYTSDTVSAWSRSTGYTFDTSTGKYTLIGGSREFSTSGGSTYWLTNHVTGNDWCGELCNGISTASQTNSVIYYDTAGQDSSGFKISHSYSTYGEIYYYNPNAMYVSWFTYTSAGSWNKGSYIGTVSSTSSSAHSEGYNSDGYWYVAV